MAGITVMLKSSAAPSAATMVWASGANIHPALVAFMRTLTDQNLANDPKYSDPFNYGDSTDGSMEGASDAQKRAAFNYYSVEGDASRVNARGRDTSQPLPTTL